MVCQVLDIIEAGTLPTLGVQNLPKSHICMYPQPPLKFCCKIHCIRDLLIIIRKLLLCILRTYFRLSRGKINMFY